MTTKQIKNWKELTELINEVDPIENTIILSGWIVNLGNKKNKYKKLFFSVVPTNIVSPIAISSDYEQSEE